MAAIQASVASSETNNAKFHDGRGAGSSACHSTRKVLLSRERPSLLLCIAMMEAKLCHDRFVLRSFTAISVPPD